MPGAVINLAGPQLGLARAALDLVIEQAGSRGIAYSAHGASSFGDSNPLQRIWRDSEVASRHAIGNPAIGAEVYGRALLGHTGGVTHLV